MADESKYLEENYDGDAEQRDAQRAEDIENAKKMAQEVEEVQQRAYEIFEDECIDLIGISGTRFEELMKKSDESDALHQYLVDGALLTCTQATLEDFILPGTGIFFLTEVISLDQVDEEDEEEQQKQPVDLGTRCKRLQTKLNVSENPMGVNGQPYATVKDTIKGRNIMPFRCNCRVPCGWTGWNCASMPWMTPFSGHGGGIGVLPCRFPAGQVPERPCIFIRKIPDAFRQDTGQ